VVMNDTFTIFTAHRSVALAGLTSANIR